MTEAEPLKPPQPTGAVIAIPAYGGITGAILPAVVAAHHAGVHTSVLEGQSLICRARSVMATQLSKAYAFILWVDSDVLFTWDDARTVLEHSRRHNCMVSGWYPKRVKNQGWGVGIAQPERRLLPEPIPNCTELEWCGFGFVCTPSWVFRRMEEMYGFREVAGITPFFMIELPPSGLYRGEDETFCSRARAVGIPIVAHREVILKHRGLHDFSADDTGGPLPSTWDEQRELEDRWFPATSDCDQK